MTFRANPQCELICADEPESNEDPVLGEDFYGYFHPHGESHLHRRKASVHTALLFLSLLQPRKLPQYIGLASKTTRDHVARLVLDSVLEVNYQGVFVSGAKAGHFIKQPKIAPANRLAQLSIDALQYAQNLVGLRDVLITHRLYLYGALPATPKLYCKYPDEQSVLSLVADNCALHPSIEKYWQERTLPPGQNNPWRKWLLKVGRPQPVPKYKLYISPTLSGLRNIVNTVAETLMIVDGTCGFKIGRDVETICRPDKMIAYFSSKDALRLAADLLVCRLAGRPAHGVPFTAQISKDGLLSWGADPPSRDTDGKDPESWRYWVVTQLAEYLSCAKSQLGGLEPWEFAIQRLRLAGIDTDRWTPPSQSSTYTLGQN
jgi:hypothetical protein